MEQFTKDDLRTGDLVVTRNGKSFIVMLNVGSNSKNTLIGKDGNWCDLNIFSNNLTCEKHANLNIIKVYRSEHQFKLLDLERDEYELIYDREAIEDKTKVTSRVKVIFDGKEYNAISAEVNSLRIADGTFNTTINITTK